jgi:2-iminoacetate synthase ThiH
MGDGVSALVERAIDAAGLGDFIAARRQGELTAAHAERLRSADLLALGALADRIRTDEVGADVVIYTADPPATDAPLVVLPKAGSGLTGLDLLREVAIARVCGPRRLGVRVDWSICGLELAQVALGFGADELSGRIVNKRGLPLGEGELLGVGKKSRHEAADLVKRKELAEAVRRSGRNPVFVGADGKRVAAHAERPETVPEETMG